MPVSKQGGLWQRLYLVGGPYWFGNTPWTPNKVITALIIIVAAIFGLNWAVSTGSHALVSAFKGITAQAMISWVNTWGIWCVAGIAAFIASAWYYRKKNPIDIEALASKYAEDPKNPMLIAWGLLLVVLGFMVSVNILNVIINHVNGAFTTALNKKVEPEYWKYLYIYASIFVIGTPIVVLNRWFRQLLGAHWRRWLSFHIIGKYFNNRAYYYINGRHDIDNPDERIHQDISNFADGALSIVLTFLGALIKLIAFVGILWGISQFLTWAVIVYALIGTALTYVLGMMLVTLNGYQLRYEADFRFSLTRVRENTESIAFYEGEAREQNQARGRFGRVYANYRRLIAAQRNLGFFTTGFEYVTIIIPALFLAPLYFKGEIEVGIIAQASMAFRMVLDSLAVVIEEFPAITRFAANVQRIGTFVEALDKPIADEAKSLIVTKFGDNRTVSLTNVTIQPPDSERILVKDLTVKIDPANSLLIVGPSGGGKSSILRVIAGFWNKGSGLVVRPEQRNGSKNMMFLPQKPYMILGSLREQLTYPNIGLKISDAELQKVLELVNLPKVAERVGGFDAVTNWSDVLSGGEQQRLAMARLLISKPQIAILDEATSALDIKNEKLIYDLLAQSGTTFISVGHRPTLTRYHKHVLELTGDGGWILMTADEYAKKQNA